jgi:hypothetical protein
MTILLKPFGARTPVALPLSSGNTLLWDLGDVRLPRRTYRHPLWIVRCAGDTGVWSELRSLAAARPPERTRILLATAAPTRLPREPPQRHLLVSIHDVLDASGNLALDGSALAAGFGSPSSGREVGEPLLVEADGRVVRLHGKEFRFSRGERQREIIRYLYGCYLSGDVIVSVAKLAEDVGLPGRTRLRDYFKGEGGKKVMSELLFEREGTCGFRLNVETK